MKIDLETVRQVLKDVLGYDSFSACFITRVCEIADHPTAGITRDGMLIYNPEFVSQYVTCKQDLFSLIFHELLHPMFNHFIHGSGEIENIAADAIINAVISTIYSDASRDGSLFRKTHSPRGLDGIMRPESRMGNSRYARLYETLYMRMGVPRDAMTTGELIQTLKILIQDENLGGVLLFGTHGKGDEGLSEDVLVRLAEDVRRSVRKNASKQVGYSELLMDLLMEALRSHLSIRRVLLSKFATKRKVDKFKELCNRRRVTSSPIPIYPSKRDIVLLGSGIYPFHFRNKLQHPQERDRGLAIYLDVSGSVNSYLPKILGILKGLRNEITTIFQFSNTVVETSFRALLKGEIKTTHGTDFSCIARSILEKDFDKAVVITDGCASMSGELKWKLKDHGLVTLTILFDGRDECDDFSEFGDLVQLDDICE